MATTPRPGATGANRATRRASAKPAAKKPATKKAATKSIDDAVDEKPRTQAHANLADLEAEAAEIPQIPPFIFDTVGDDDPEDFIEIGHPGNIPFAITSSGNLDSVFAHAMSDDDWEKFVNADLTSLQATFVFGLWRKHYGMGSQGE